MNALDRGARRNEIILSVLKKYGISMDDLVSRSRFPGYVNARVEVAARLFNELGFSKRRIGKILERDHSTVSYWLNHRPEGCLPEDLFPISREVREHIESIAVKRRMAPKLVIIEWITERARFEIQNKRSAA